MLYWINSIKSLNDYRIKIHSLFERTTCPLSSSRTRRSGVPGTRGLKRTLDSWASQERHSRCAFKGKLKTFICDRSKYGNLLSLGQFGFDIFAIRFLLVQPCLFFIGGMRVAVKSHAAFYSKFSLGDHIVQQLRRLVSFLAAIEIVF